MPKGTRLTRTDFKDFTHKSRREHGALFTLVVTLRTDDKGPKAACIVSKKVAARAVDRNLIKRRARAALADALRDVLRPLSLAFYAKKGVLEAPFSDIARDVRALLARAVQ